MPQLTSIVAGDRAYLVRETSPGQWADKSFDPSALGLPLLQETTTIDPADIPALDTVVKQIVAAPSATQIIVPRVVMVRYLGWTTPWTTSALIVGSSSLLNNSRYCLSAPSETAGVTSIAFPFYAGQLTTVLAGDGLSVKAFATLSGGDAAFSITTYYHLIDA